MKLSALLREWHLAEPIALVALVLVVLPWVASWKRKRLGWPTIDGFRGVSSLKASVLRFLPDLLLSFVIALIALALARPQAIGGQTRIAAKGVALVVAIDRSASMDADDFRQSDAKKTSSRLDAAKATLSHFIEGRPDDLIGVISFADVPRRISPPTLDHGFVLDAVRAIRPAHSGEGGTNLGHAIAFGLGELQGLTTPRKVLVLLTDGRDSPAASDTSKPIAPEAAAELSKALGITMHTIAIGGPGAGVSMENLAKKPIADSGPDLERLELLAKLGGGKAFSAGNSDALAEVFKTIDELERSPFVGTVKTRYREGYPVLVAIALVCLVIERYLRAGPLRILP